MTRDEFITRYRPRLLLFLTEAWACRTKQPSELGLLVDGHARQIELILDDIFKRCIEKPVNGVAAPKAPVMKGQP